jgi:DNA polymerase-3 subunit delta'
MLFASIPGLPDIKENLINAVINNHLAHALLFYGPEGSATLPMALALCTYLFCENPSDRDSCGKCGSCQRMSKLVMPDLNFAFPEITVNKKEEDSQSEDDGKDDKSNLVANWRKFAIETPFGNIHDFILFNSFEKKQLNISKGAARKIIQTLSLKAFEGGYKIMLVWGTEYLHPSAANALLKILEEPQPKTIFLLITAYPDQLLTTILSRTQKVLIRAFSDDEIQKHLIAEGIADEATANQIAMIADGSMREAFRLADQVEDQQIKGIREWFLDCYKADFRALFVRAEVFHKDSIEGQKSLILTAMNVLREILLKGANLDQLLRTRGEDLDFVTKISSTILKVEHIEPLYQVFNQAHYHLERNGNAKFIFTDLSMDISILMSKIS